MREPKIQPKRTGISVSEARDEILGVVAPMGKETVDLRTATGRILAESIEADRLIPPRDNSAMDGFAVRSADLTEPGELRVVLDLPAGHPSDRKLGPGEAARIMTGAAIPDGADAVVMQEETSRQGDTLRVERAVREGQHIRRAGSDVRPGTPLTQAGSAITPALAGMLASIGRTSVSVIGRPRVAILATGDELVEPDRLENDGKIASSNSYTLYSAIQEIGAEPVYLGIAPDTPEDIEASFRSALSCDVVVSTGGVSVGDRDWIKQVLADLGGSMKLWRVDMKPGAPLAFSTLEGRPVFGLPGNPVSTMVTFEHFVRPALLRMMGHQKIFRPVVQARLSDDYTKPAGRMHFVRVELERAVGGWLAKTTGDQSSGVLLSMVRADGLAVIDGDETHVPGGTEVPVLLLRSSELSEEPGF